MWWKHKSPSNPCLSSVQRLSWSDFTVHKDGEWRDKRGEGGGQEARGCVSGSAAEAPPGYRSRGLSATNTQASLRTTREGFCSVCTDSSPSNSGSRSDCCGQPSVESHGPSACRAPRDTCREEQFQQVWGTTADNQTLLRGGWRAARVCKCSQSCLVFSIFLSARLVPTDRPDLL